MGVRTFESGELVCAIGPWGKVCALFSVVAHDGDKVFVKMLKGSTIVDLRPSKATQRMGADGYISGSILHHVRDEAHFEAIVEAHQLRHDTINDIETQRRKHVEIANAVFAEVLAQ